MTYTEVLKQGEWPSFLKENLISELPELGCSSKERLTYRCVLHGDYSKTISSVLRNPGCPKCIKIESTRKESLRRRSNNPFPDRVSRLIAQSPDRDLILECRVGNHDNVRFYCPEHGEFESTIHSLMAGSDCPECSKIRLSRERRLKDLENKHYPEWFLDEIKESPDAELILSGKVVSDEKVRWICPIHGEYKRSLRAHFHYGGRCPTCSKDIKFIGISQKKRDKNPFPEEFREELTPEYQSLLDNGLLKASDHALFVCPTHGVYRQLVYGHLAGKGCLWCGYQSAAKKVQEDRRLNNPYPKWFIKDLEGSPDKDRVLSGDIKVSEKITFICKKHGPYKQRIDSHLYSLHKCPTCGAKTSIYGSRIECEIRDHLKKLGVRVIHHYRSLISRERGRHMELDLYLPDYKVAIEVNGLYWHSFEYLMKKCATGAWNQEEIKYYHKYKSDQCRDLGVTLVHVWEDDFLERKESVLSLILSKCGLLKRDRIMARECSVREISYQNAISFFSDYHIQGPGQGVTFGLIYKEQVVSAVQIMRAKPNERDAGSHILNRYASKRGVFVVGGFAKLCRYAEKTLLIKRWVTYADLAISNGDLYKVNGWNLIGEVDADYKYVYKGRRVHKFNFRINRFKEDPDLEFREGLSEAELAQLNGIRRIYDCGKLKFEKVVV